MPDQGEEKIGQKMNAIIEILNRGGEVAVHFAWPMLWQSSVLIAVLFAIDFALRRRVRAAVRYALWLVLLVKLLLPPSLALPTSAAWWLFPSAAVGKPPTTRFVVSYGPDTAPRLPLQPTPIFSPPRSTLSTAAWIVLVWCILSFGLLVWMTAHWRQVARGVKRATPAPAWLDVIFDLAKGSTRLRRAVRLRVTDQAMSPAVCGLFRPVILLPQSLVQKLPPNQLRAVLLHELAHLRRGDVWANCVQALLQIVYWWHPLLWLTNARIRRVREEAVDDAVMLALRDEAETYAPTLLEVAKLAFHRPLASLGLVGILESRSALRQRIERLMDFRTPRRAGLTLASLCGICLFSTVALPMGESPATPSNASKVDRKEIAGLPLNYTPPQVHIKATFIETPEEMTTSLGANLITTSVTNVAGILTGPNFRLMLHALEQDKRTEFLAEPEVTTISGRQTQMRATTTKDITTQYLADSDNSTIVPRYEKVEVGPVLDVIPVVLPDGYTINLTATPSLTEFLGYYQPTNSILAGSSAGTNVIAPSVLPRFRVRQAVTQLKLWDDQTVVLGNLQDRLVPGTKEVDVKPGSEIHKHLLVFVTVTLVDPAGNRIHSDEEIARKQHAATGFP